MAIIEHASTPAVQRSTSSGTVQTITTAAFAPPANSLLLCMAVNELSPNPTSQPTRTITDSTGGTWTQLVNRPGAVASNYGQISIWCRPLITAPGSMTVSVNRGSTAASDTSVAVRVLTGAASNQAGAGIASGASAEVSTSVLGGNITTTTAGSRVYACAGLGGAETITAKPGTTTIDGWHDTANFSEIYHGRLTADTVTPGIVAVGWNRGASSAADSVWAAVEILPIQPTAGRLFLPF